MSNPWPVGLLFVVVVVVVVVCMCVCVCVSFLYDEKKYWGRQLKTGTDTFFFRPIIVCTNVAFLKQNEQTCTYLTIAE